MNIFMIDEVVCSKVKGEVRDLVGSVQVLAASDEFNFLNKCKDLIHAEVKKCLPLLAPHNVERMRQNLSGVPVLQNDARFHRFVLDLPRDLETKLQL